MPKVLMGGNISQVQLKVKAWQWDLVKSCCWQTWQGKELTHLMWVFGVFFALAALGVPAFQGIGIQFGYLISVINL